MTKAISKIPAKDKRDNLDSASRGPVQQTLLGCIAKGDNELAEEIGDTSIWDIARKGVKAECPSQRVDQCLFQLVSLEVLVTDALLVDPDTLDCKSPVLLAEPSGVELIVGHEDEKENTNGGSQEARDKEHNFPRCDCRSVQPCTLCDPIRHQPAKDLRESIEAEPNARSKALLFLGVPL